MLSKDCDIWNFVEFSYHELTIKINSKVVTKPKDKWDTINERIYLLILKSRTHYIITYC